MATNVIMPALGVAQQTGTLLKWLKSEGQSVTKGEPLMEIETDKATVEIEAAASGILTAVTAQPGDEIPVGQKIAVILAPGEAAPKIPEGPVEVPLQHQRPHPSPLPQEEGKMEGHAVSVGQGKFEGSPARNAISGRDLQSKQEGRASAVPVLPSGEGRGDGLSVPSTAARPASTTTRILASPKAKRMARETGVELATLQGSGPEGSILAADVMKAIGEIEFGAAAIHEAVMPLNSMRRIVGQRMTQSKQSAPHFYLNMDIDMTAVDKIRGAWKDGGDPSIPSLNDFMLYAAARALKDFPSVNSTYTDYGIQQHADINIGMAVALDEGLVVPVVRNADRLSLSELAVRCRELIDKAQTKKLFPLDYEGGTFTVSNLGMLGVDSFIAIINPPQCAILAVGRVTPRVVVEDGMFAIKSMMTATLSADHRIIDGAVGARFLQRVKHYLERRMS